MEYNFITLGFNCAPAIILKELGLRRCSLPFDWVVTNNMQIINCIEDDFQKFHKNLEFTLNNHWFIDDYGIQYPHDYPVDEDDVIVSNWKDFHQDVIYKYKRRIERFKTILTSPTPIISLYLGPIKYALKLKKYIDNKYNKNLIFIVATYEKNLPYMDNVIIVNVFTPFRIENAQRQRYLSLIYAHKVGVLNEKRCKIDSN